MLSTLFPTPCHPSTPLRNARHSSEMSSQSWALCERLLLMTWLEVNWPRPQALDLLYWIGVWPQISLACLRLTLKLNIRQHCLLLPTPRLKGWVKRTGNSSWECCKRWIPSEGLSKTSGKLAHIFNIQAVTRIWSLGCPEGNYSQKLQTEPNPWLDTEQKARPAHLALKHNPLMVCPLMLWLIAYWGGTQLLCPTTQGDHFNPLIMLGALI